MQRCRQPAPTRGLSLEMEWIDSLIGGWAHSLIGGWIVEVPSSFPRFRSLGQLLGLKSPLSLPQPPKGAAKMAVTLISKCRPTPGTSKNGAPSSGYLNYRSRSLRLPRIRYIQTYEQTRTQQSIAAVNFLVMHGAERRIQTNFQFSRGPLFKEGYEFTVYTVQVAITRSIHPLDRFQKSFRGKEG